MTKKRSDILLPPASNGLSEIISAPDRRIVIIGVNGAGKSRFMEEMIRLNADRALSLSALSSVGQEPGELYRLAYMLLADHITGTAEAKRESKQNRQSTSSRLHRISHLWKEIFPGSQIRLDKEGLKFSTTAGEDLIGIGKLSQGEKTVLYYAASILFAPHGSLVFIDSPSLFLHPSITGTFWASIERMRQDCRFVFNSVDLDFIGSTDNSLCLRIESYDSLSRCWDYRILDASSLPEEVLTEVAGNRKPILFIEGDSRHSIDVKLYSLVFPDWTIRPLGSCNKVIETTRTFNDLKAMHQLQARGIVDRDRRTDMEVEYLRKKEILVPDVAEIENVFLLPAIIRIMARRRAKNPEKVFGHVHKEVMRMFRHEADRQALQHVRHMVKREVECKIDARFTCITALETHLKTLVYKLKPREYFNQLRRYFASLLHEEDYEGILKVFNHKPMLPNSGVHQLLGYHSKEDYIRGVIETLREPGKDAEGIRKAVKNCFHIIENQPPPDEEFENHVCLKAPKK